MRFTEFISEDANPKRQAAIAIAMKKAGKKPKDMSEGWKDKVAAANLGGAVGAGIGGAIGGPGAALAGYGAGAGLVGAWMRHVNKHNIKYDLGHSYNNQTEKNSKNSADTVDLRRRGLLGLGLAATLAGAAGSTMAPRGWAKKTLDWPKNTDPEYDSFFKGSQDKSQTEPITTSQPARADIASIQKQYDWQFGDIKGPDKIIKIVNKASGGKIAITAKDKYYLIAMWDDIKSDPNIAKMFDPGPYGIVLLALPKSAMHESEDLDEGENWSKYNHKRVGGMSKKSVSSYRRSHPGSKIQTAVTTKPSKLKKGSKAAKRRASFCARMRGMKKHRTGAKTAHDPNSNINKSLRRWHCESIEELHELVMLAEQYIRNNKK